MITGSMRTPSCLISNGSFKEGDSTFFALIGHHLSRFRHGRTSNAPGCHPVMRCPMEPTRPSFDPASLAILQSSIDSACVLDLMGASPRNRTLLKLLRAKASDAACIVVETSSVASWL